jgi:hypothetical protein
MKVDSHQAKQRDLTSKKGRYQEFSPNGYIEATNQVADNAASYALGTMDKIPFEPIDQEMDTPDAGKNDHDTKS